MEFFQIITPLVAIYTIQTTNSVPINNGFSVKFNPLNMKEVVKPKSFGALFAKIPQMLTAEAKERRKIISKAYYPNPPELGVGTTNQIAKLIFPKNCKNDSNDIQASNSVNFINLPILKQPMDDYKILVATAPEDLKINGDKNQSLVVYVVFREDGTDDSNGINIPSIYFVNQLKGKMDSSNIKQKAEPVLIMDSNRTVTGIRSKEIEKYLTFRNKFGYRYNYKIVS